MKRKQLPTHLSLPSAAGARTSCFRWRRSDGFHRSSCCHRLALLLARGAGCSAASSCVWFSCAPSEGRRFPAPAAWAGSHGEAALRAGGRLPWRGKRREWMWPRGQAWPCADPRVTSSAGAPGGAGTSAEQVAGPALSAEPPGLAHDCMIALSFSCIVEFGVLIFMFRWSIDYNFLFSYRPRVK